MKKIAISAILTFIASMGIGFFVGRDLGLRSNSKVVELNEKVDTLSLRVLKLDKALNGMTYQKLRADSTITELYNDIRVKQANIIKLDSIIMAIHRQSNK